MRAFSARALTMSAIMGRLSVSPLWAFPHLLAQVAVVGILQHGQAAGRMEGEHPFPFFPACLGLCCGVFNDIGRDSGEVGLVVNHNLKSVVGRQQVLVELDVEVRQTAVHLLEGFLVGVVEQGAVAHKVLVGLLEGAYLVVSQPERVLAVIEILHAVEQAGVHHHLVRESAVARQQFLRHLLQFCSGISFGERHEHRHHAFKRGRHIVESQNGVGESGCLGVVHNRVDRCVGLGDAGIECRLVVGDLNLLERRDLELVAVRLHERILPLLLAAR